MGGNAIKNSRRFEVTEYKKYCVAITPILENIFGKDNFFITRHLHKKDSFGDMDVIAKYDNLKVDFRNIIKENFGDVEIHHNSHVWSINYNDLQVDLILTEPDSYETSKVFFYSELGNFMGKLMNNYGKIRKYRIRYGFDGLKFSVYAPNSTNKIGKVYLTKDMAKVFEFLGLSYDKFLEGFDTIEDIFNYICGSKYFDSESFQYENLNHENKNRNKRRPNYIYLIKWLEDNKIYHVHNFDQDEDYYIQELLNFFSPDGRVQREIDETIYNWELNQKISEKFNGSHIIEKFGLKGEKLGNALSTYQNTFSSYVEYRNFIINNDLDYILTDFGMKILDVN